MAAFNDLNGVPCTVNRFLLRDILKDSCGFPGFVVSDANAIRECEVHGICADDMDAAIQAASAGMDMDMGTEIYVKNLKEAVESGKLSMEVVSAEKNAELLESVPHERMEDMAVVYLFVLDQTYSGNGTILVTNQLLDQYGI